MLKVVSSNIAAAPKRHPKSVKLSGSGIQLLAVSISLLNELTNPGSWQVCQPAVVSAR